MCSIQRKLHSEYGTSLLVALLPSLICLTMGSLILTAATVSAVKAKDRYESQQNYLAVASATRLIKDTTGSYTYIRGKTWQSWQTGIDPATGLPIIESDWKKITPSFPPDDESDFLTDAYDDMRGLTKYRSSFEIKADEGTSGVRAEFVMGQGGDATIVLTAGEYSMAVLLTVRTVHTTDHTVYDYCKASWSSGVTTKGADQMRRKRSPSGETLVEAFTTLLLMVFSSMLPLQMAMAPTRISTQSKEMDALCQKVLAATEQQTSPISSTGSIDIGGRSYDTRYYTYSGASSDEELISYAQCTGGGGRSGRRTGCTVVPE